MAVRGCGATGSGESHPLFVTIQSSGSQRKARQQRELPRKVGEEKNGEAFSLTDSPDLVLCGLGLTTCQRTVHGCTCSAAHHFLCPPSLHALRASAAHKVGGRSGFTLVDELLRPLS